MTDDSASSTTRRGVLKTGALGLGTLGGAVALGGVSAPAATASTPRAAVPGAAGLTTETSADYFLLLDGIPGESLNEQHRGWIDVHSYDWAASNPSTITGTPAKSTIDAITFESDTSKASTLLFLQTMTNKRLRGATLEAVSQGTDSPRLLIRLDLREVLITSYSTSASDSSGVDRYTVLFNRITYSYFPQDERGGSLPPVVATWDVRNGRPF